MWLSAYNNYIIITNYNIVNLKPVKHSVTQTAHSIFIPPAGSSSWARICLKSSGFLWLVRPPPIFSRPQIFLQIFTTSDKRVCPKRDHFVFCKTALADIAVVLLCNFPLIRAEGHDFSYHTFHFMHKQK